MKAPAGGVLGRLLAEPTVVFFGLALGFFALHGAVGPEDPDLLVVHRSKIEVETRAKLGRAPTPSELQDAVERAVEQLALQKEAVRLGLHSTDRIIERRLVQKMDMLAEDLATLEPVTEAELQTRLTSEPERYRRPERRDVEQVYFRKAEGRVRAETALAEVSAGADPARLGDPFAAGRRFEGWTERRLGQALGADVAQQAFGVAPDTWAGPFASGYGWHLVRVRASTPARAARLEEVRAQVEADVERTRREAAVTAARAAAKARYRVEIRP